MSSKFATSGVLTSGVDYFCLACECRLHHECGAIAHIEMPVHVKNFETTDYFENKENYVRKINKWYFCELCSILLTTAARVRLHVAEPQHLENKCTRILQRIGTTVFAFSCVQIDDKAWQGIMDGTCVICNTEIDDEDIHINQTNHIIKLIHSKVEFDCNRNIFRKVDECSVQCITCNMIIGMASLDNHFNETEHKNLYQSCCDAYKTTIKKSALEKTEGCEIKEVPQDIQSEDVEHVTNNNLKVQEVKHDKSNQEEAEVSCDLEENIENYIKQNEMSSYTNKNEIYCMLCNSNIPYSLRSLKEHVKGVKHQRNMSDKKAKVALASVKTKSKDFIEANLNKIKIGSYITHFFVFKGFNADVVLNGKICITLFSFLLMVDDGDKFKCLICNERIQKFLWKQHMTLKYHEDTIDENFLVISKKHVNEFVREYRPGCFHCGYCNIQFASWEAVESHLKSSAHRDNKTSCERRLNQAAAQIFFHKQKTQLLKEFKLRSFMLDMFRFNNYRSDSNVYSDSVSNVYSDRDSDSD